MLGVNLSTPGLSMGQHLQTQPLDVQTWYYQYFASILYEAFSLGRSLSSDALQSAFCQG